MKIAIIGGHFSPALAVIEELKQDKIYYIGRKYVFEGDKAVSFEYQEIEKLKIPFFGINTARLQRKFTKHTVPSLTKFPLGFYQSLRILNKVKPDVVVGFGGYLSLPVILAAALLRMPVVIHEQTLKAGFANKLASRFARKVCLSWESSRRYFPKEKVVLTGNPINQEIVNAKKKEVKQNDRPLIYITGGSSGSHVLNLLVEQALDILLQKYSIIHQTGGSEAFKDFDRLEKRQSEHYQCKKFLNPSQAALALNTANLVVGRAGINTITELIYLEKPCFLIPLTVGQKNEQLGNAEFIKSLGLGEFMKQDAITPDLLVSEISSMIENLKSYKLKEKILIEDAAKKIVEVLRNVSSKKT